MRPTGSPLLRPKGRLASHKRRGCNNNATLTSTTPAPTTDNIFADASPPTITDTIFPPPPTALITATNTTCLTPTTSDYLPPAISNTTTTPSTGDWVSSSHELEYQYQQQTPPPDPPPSDLSCPHCHRTCTSRIGLVGHCKSIVQKPANQWQEHQHTPAAPNSTLCTAHTHLHTAWAYKVTCVSIKTCGGTPPATPQHYISPHQSLHLT
ncbi:unnamed protein product [Schistocephalus solidus]|uniref:C2H2-type domain-containing protein n=1 Tax=Schistocephalus solidus TaxID=70667 RepID=A0A183T4X2_SCHSO|nr:unnamed protein product [Schistocephalus solidus]